MPLVTLSFQHTMKRFNKGIFIRCSNGRTLMLQACFLTEGIKGFAYKLGPIVRTNHELWLSFRDTPCCHSLPERTQDTLRVAGFTAMVSNDSAIKDINNTCKEKVPTFPCNITILYIHLPQLVGPIHHSIIGYFPRYGIRSFMLRKEDTEGLTEPVHLLFVNHQVVFPAQQHGQFSVAKRYIRPLDQTSKKPYNSSIRNAFSLLVVGVTRDLSSATYGLLSFGVFQVIIIGRARYIADPKHRTDRIASLNPNYRGL